MAVSGAVKSIEEKRPDSFCSIWRVRAFINMSSEVCARRADPVRYSPARCSSALISGAMPRCPNIATGAALVTRCRSRSCHYHTRSSREVTITGAVAQGDVRMLQMCMWLLRELLWLLAVTLGTVTITPGEVQRLSIGFSMPQS